MSDCRKCDDNAHAAVHDALKHYISSPANIATLNATLGRDGKGVSIMSVLRDCTFEHAVWKMDEANSGGSTAGVVAMIDRNGDLVFYSLNELRVPRSELHA